jgi:hypothetical protein
MQQPELPPAFLQVRDQIREARKTLLKDPAFTQPQQLKQFIAQFVLPLMETTTTLFGSAFVDTYMLAATDHEEIGRLRDALGGDGDDSAVTLDDLNDLQKAFYTLGSVIQGKNDAETKAAYEVCAHALADFVSLVTEDMREGSDDPGHDHDHSDMDDEGDDEVLDATPTEVV